MEQSEKSGRDVIKTQATDMIHFGCIHTYMSRINNEVYDSIREFDKQEIRKVVVRDLREELRQEVYDEVLHELSTTCSVCQAELETEEEEDQDPIVKSAIVKGPELPPPLPNPFGQFGFK